MKNYFRLMLGQKSVHVDECLAGNFVGTDFGITQNLAQHLTDEPRAFRAAFAPQMLLNDPEKTKAGAAQWAGFLWTVSKGMSTGDVVLCPDGTGHRLRGHRTRGADCYLRRTWQLTG